jgi:hypothetical protein
MAQMDRRAALAPAALCIALGCTATQHPGNDSRAAPYPPDPGKRLSIFFEKSYGPGEACIGDLVVEELSMKNYIVWPEAWGELFPDVVAFVHAERDQRSGRYRASFVLMDVSGRRFNVVATSTQSFEPKRLPTALEIEQFVATAVRSPEFRAFARGLAEPNRAGLSRQTATQRDMQKDCAEYLGSSP